MDWTSKVSSGLRRRLIGLAIRAVMGTSRVRFARAERPAELARQGTPLIHVFWHRHIFAVIHVFRDRGAIPLISLSSDGEIVAQVAEDFGMRPVRGSSSTGGTRALLRLLRLLRERPAPLLITADGPKGPARRIKPGTLLLAQKTGAAIVPVAWQSSRQYVFGRSWDRFLLPLPFGRLQFCYGEPVFIAADGGAEALATAGRELEQRLDLLEEEALAGCGRPGPLL